MIDLISTDRDAIQLQQYIWIAHTPLKPLSFGYDNSTHFRLMPSSSTDIFVWCTHGAWKGKLHFDSEGCLTGLTAIHPVSGEFPMKNVQWWATEGGGNAFADLYEMSFRAVELGPQEKVMPL